MFMKALAQTFLLLILTCAAVGVVAAQAPVREVLSNDSIINLTKAGFKENTIIALIRTSPVSFDITTAKLVALKKANVSEKVITAMIERQTFGAGGNSMLSLSDDEFFRQGDEEFFKGNGPTFKELPGEKNTQPREGEVDIFGSRSGSRSKNQSRGLGGNHGGTSEGETLGSATVKILRPPSEAGGASDPKLERAPKLDNKAVLDLIQAGFSEGTILRKIENSQVDFDLSPKALSELRKNRVSEAVLKAMAEAMGVETK
jgi:hypothetical protein